MMATGYSAFSVCNSMKNSVTEPIVSPSPILSAQYMKLDEVKRSPILMKSTSMNLKNNLVNSSFTSRSKEDFIKFPILYLFEAHEMMSKGSTCINEPKNSLENNNSELEDGVASSDSKRFKFQNGSTPKAKKSLTKNKDRESSSGMVSMDSLSTTRTKKFGDRPDVIYKTILRSFK